VAARTHPSSRGMGRRWRDSRARNSPTTRPQILPIPPSGALPSRGTRVTSTTTTPPKNQHKIRRASRGEGALKCVIRSRPGKQLRQIFSRVFPALPVTLGATRQRSMFRSSHRRHDSRTHRPVAAGSDIVNNDRRALPRSVRRIARSRRGVSRTCENAPPGMRWPIKGRTDDRRVADHQFGPAFASMTVASGWTKKSLRASSSPYFSTKNHRHGLGLANRAAELELNGERSEVESARTRHNRHRAFWPDCAA
jgi:hypothetical protein